MTTSRSNRRRSLPRLHLITNDELLRAPSFASTATALLEAGGEAVALHLRGGAVPGRVLGFLAESLRDTASRSGGLLIVNDRLDVALAYGAAGVQLGQRSVSVEDARQLVGPAVLIGKSVHSPDEAADPSSRGADFLLAGTLYSSASHPGTQPTGCGWLPGLASLGAPVIGIGGITVDKVPDVLASGAHGVAVIAGVWNAASPIRALEQFLVKLG